MKNKKIDAKVEKTAKKISEMLMEMGTEIMVDGAPCYLDAWSYSSMLLFLRNAAAFKRKYLLRIYEDMSSMAMTVGKACHDALRMHYAADLSQEDAIRYGFDYLEECPDNEINYGKTGSREILIKKYGQAMLHYFNEEPKYHKILAVEEPMVTYIEIGGKMAGIPIKCIPDLVTENAKGEIEIVDHKFISSYSNLDEEDAAHAVQAVFNYYPVKAWLQEQGIDKPIKRMIYQECKVSKNENGAAQIQPYIVEFDAHQEYFTLFENLYNDCTAELMRPDKKFLPNFLDHLDGNLSFALYKSELMGADAPVAVEPKTREIRFMEKRFLKSAVDKVENKHLGPEERIRIKLLDLGIPVEMQETVTGPNIVRYTLKPGRGIRMGSLDKHAKDLAYVLKARTIRIEAPIMGTDLVGVEVPNANRTYNAITMTHPALVPGTTNIPIGVNVTGETVVKALEEMPHLLVAGATGSGKSVMINVIIKSLMWQNSPEDLQFILIDPKRLELSPYRDDPHVMDEVIFDEDKARRALDWLVEEMEARYGTLDNAKCKNIAEYNAKHTTRIPRIVVVIDEFADLILQTKGQAKENRRKDKYETASKSEKSKVKKLQRKEEVSLEEVPETERMIVRLAQKARAAGIHLVLGTQRPSTDVVTGLIRANLPTRIAFATASRIDSQVILDISGAEQLLGKGDMLFLDPHTRGLQRLQGFFLPDGI